MRVSKERVQSVERAMHILDCFTMESPELHLGEISQMTGLSKSTVFRLLSTLIGCGYIKQDASTQKYSLGFKAFHLGAVVASNISLRAVAFPYMQKLCDQLSETIGLSIIDENYRVIIETLESPELIRNIIKVGQRVHLCVGASSLAMLAYLPESRRHDIIAHAIATNQLSMEPEALIKKLEVISKRGYDYSVNERIQGAFSIAAPIFDFRGLVGGLTVAGPVQRLSATRLEEMIQSVKSTALQISEAMGFVESYPRMKGS